MGISIHALREEGDLRLLTIWPWLVDFYPRPPRGGRPVTNPAAFTGGRISIHALREEGDGYGGAGGSAGGLFLSTPSARRATADRLQGPADPEDFYPRPPRGGRRDDLSNGRGQFRISIHALREEGDSSIRVAQSFRLHFYPRPPRGGRRFCSGEIQLFFQFLSTPSARRATRISGKFRSNATDFYPRPPRGGRRGFMW